MDLMRSFLPSISSEEGGDALARVLARRGCRTQPLTAHTAAALPDLQAGLSPGTRLFTHFVSGASDRPAAWVLDETTAGVDLWDPLLARELSAEFGGFVVNAQASRSLGRCGSAVFFAGRTIEFTLDDPVSGRFDLGGSPQAGSTVARIEHTLPALADLYAQLTGYPASDLFGEPDILLSSVVARGCPCETAWRPSCQDEAQLALAVFALAAHQEFAAAWDETGGAGSVDWHWRAVTTPAAEIPYILAMREGGLDMSFCEALAHRLDVPAAAVAVRAPGLAFDWWSAQPGEVPQYGQALGAVAFVQHLMPAMVALGERPGILRIVR
jgi:hypothetical protein